MTRRSPLLLAALVFSAVLGAACDGQPILVTVLGDSHSDMDRSPPYDWLYWAPPTWVINEHATWGMTCRHVVLAALEDPDALAGDVMVIFCGTNDAGGNWDLGVTMGWIQTAIDQGRSQGSPVVVVTPPPALTDTSVLATLRNLRLAQLREAIFELEEEFEDDEDPFEIEVTDVWDAILTHWNFAALYSEDGLHLTGGRVVMYHEIAQAVERARD